MLAKIVTKILLVDDDECLRQILTLVLEDGGFEVKAACNVNDALKLIGCQTFDVLVSDLHLPSAGDGLKIVRAMRHSNPDAATFILSDSPEMKGATDAILAQTDAILVKPMGMGTLVASIKERLEMGVPPARAMSSLATLLEETAQTTIKDWLCRVEKDPEVTRVWLDDSVRSSHLPQLFRDLVFRLSNPRPVGCRAFVSPSAGEHGLARREQGYTAAMMVEESRMLQVSIFQTLQNNLCRVNVSLVLVGVMEIADEVDSQLAQAMTSYVAQSRIDALPITA